MDVDMDVGATPFVVGQTVLVVREVSALMDWGRCWSVRTPCLHTRCQSLFTVQLSRNRLSQDKESATCTNAAAFDKSPALVAVVDGNGADLLFEDGREARTPSKF